MSIIVFMAGFCVGGIVINCLWYKYHLMALRALDKNIKEILKKE